MRTSAQRHPVCPTCRYDLTGLRDPRCPECGRQFSYEEWNDASLLVPMPAWERAGRVNAILAFPATFVFATFRPREFARRLRRDEGLLRVVLFGVLLIPTAWLLAVLLSIAAATLGVLIRDWLPNHAWWEGHLIGFEPTWKWRLYVSSRVAIHCTSFLAASLLVWLPALVALDLFFWRNRRPFRLLSKVLLYSMVWSCWVAAVAATIGRAVMEQFNMEWAWGPAGRDWISEGIMPWICWVAATLATVQCVWLLRFVRSKRCAFRACGPQAVGVVSRVLLASWLFAMYLLLLDRHLLVRFYLLFGDDLLSPYYRGLVP